MSGRTIAIGDIHGCSKALRTLIEVIDPGFDDTLVFLGDYIDRGSDSRGVIDQLIDLRSRTNVISLLGNHEIMFLAVIKGGADDEIWHACGGAATLASYGGAYRHVPESHIAFLTGCRRCWENETTIFAHACYLPNVPIDEVPDRYLFWEHLPPLLPMPHISEKRIFLGHTPQANHEVLNVGHLVCIDTYCFGGGWLTAMQVENDDVWQANYHGHARRNVGKQIVRSVKRIANRWKRRR